MEDIDYTEKIATFNLLVGNNNEEIALNYLTLANWDETKAAMLYNQENKGAEAKLQNSNIPIEQNIPPKNNINNNKNDIIDNNDMPSNYLDHNYFSAYNYIDPSKGSKLDKYRECKIFKEGFLDALNIFKKDNRGYFPNFGNITQKCIKLYDNFIINLNTNVGIILVYNKYTYNDALNTLKKINEDELTKDIINSRTIIIPLISGCSEANQIIKELKIKSFPTIVVCFYKNHTHFAVIGIINNINQNMKLLTEKLIEAHGLFEDGKKFNYPKNKPDTNLNIINNNNNNNKNSNKNNNILNDINNYLPDDVNPNRDSYSNMTDGEVLANQEKEMKKLEKMEENKKLEEEKRKRKEKEEEERKKEEELLEKIKADSILNILPQEPNDDNPDKCVIKFRYPDGEKVVERKFLKTDKVSLLYLYVRSLGREIYSEKEEKNFSLIQTFPFKNFDEVQNNSLEQEGLFPNGILQIRTN